MRSAQKVATSCVCTVFCLYLQRYLFKQKIARFLVMIQAETNSYENY